MNKPIGTFFFEKGILTEDQIAKVWEHAKKNGKQFEVSVLELGFVDEKTLAPALGEFLRTPFIDLESYLIDPVIGRIIPEHISKRHLIVAINQVGNRLTVAMVDPTNIIAIDDVQLMTGLMVKPVIATKTALLKSLEEVFSG